MFTGLLLFLRSRRIWRFQTRTKHSIFGFMKTRLYCVVLLGFGLVVSVGSASTEKTDPLTGLPLYPAISNGDPVKLPEVMICQSKMQTNMYRVHDAKIDATVAWCLVHFPGFKQAHQVCLSGDLT